MEKLKFIDLFAGIGGFRLALEQSGCDCVFTSEWDKYSQQTYQANFGEIPNGDITKIPTSKIPSFDILCAGFPCQAFSISGKQKGFEDTRGTLFFDVARIAESHKLAVLFLENVKNFEVHNSGKTLETVINTLNEIGYSVFYQVLNASNFGVPTSRQRIYIVAFNKNLNISQFKFPNKSGSEVKLLDFLDNNSVEADKYEIVRDDIVLRQLDIKPDIFGLYPQKPIRVGSIGKGGQGERIYSPLGHAITLSAYGGGVASKTGAYLIDDKIRKLTIRECARIMGFPDDFIVPVSSSQAYKQFGNSVAVPVIAAIFKSICKVLNENKLCQIKKITPQISDQKLPEMVF